MESSTSGVFELTSGIESNAVIHLKAPLVGASPTRVPLEFAFSKLEEARVRKLFAGVYSLVSARKPTSKL